MRWIFFSVLLLTTVYANAQVPFDTSGVQTLKEIRRWDLPTGIRRNINAVSSFCGIPGNDVVVSRIHEVSPQTWSQTSPFDTVNIYNWPTGPETSTALEIDYDGVHPFEYFTENGEVFRCRADLNLPEERIDSLSCATFVSSETKYRCDVDNNGLDDIVIDPKNSTSNYADVILSGAEYGLGCKRVMSLPRKPGNNGVFHSTLWVRFYRDFDGHLRMLISRTVGSGEYQGLYLYKVVLSKSGTEWDIQYVATDSILVKRDQFLSPIVQYIECVVKDTVHRHHYAVNQWTTGYRYGRDVLNEPVVSVYLIDGGRFVETEAIVGVLGYFQSHEHSYDGGDPLITCYLDGDIYYYISRITQLAKPIGRMPWFITAPYQTFINDQNADGKRDFLIASDHVPGQMRLYDMNTSTTYVEQEKDLVDWISLIVDQLHITTTQTRQLYYRITNTLGKNIFTGSVSVDTQPFIIDLSTTLSHQPTGLYFVSAECGSKQRTFTIIR